VAALAECLPGYVDGSAAGARFTSTWKERSASDKSAVEDVLRALDSAADGNFDALTVSQRQDVLRGLAGRYGRPSGGPALSDLS
jgi:hypothetical protein